MNKVILVGNLSKDPELSKTTTDVSVCKFPIAVNRKVKTASGVECDFFNVVTWRGTAENCAKFLTKGNKVCICGSLQNRSYEDKDGIKRYVTEVFADEVQFLTPKAGDKKTDVDIPVRAGMTEVIDDDEDLPF